MVPNITENSRMTIFVLVHTDQSVDNMKCLIIYCIYIHLIVNIFTVMHACNE